MTKMNKETKDVIYVVSWTTCYDGKEHRHTTESKIFDRAVASYNFAKERFSDVKLIKETTVVISEEVTDVPDVKSQRVLLPNRCGFENYLELVGDNEWILVLNDSELTLRVATNDDGSIYMIDPSGGPYMQVGGTIQDIGEIESIRVEGGKMILKIKQ